jgi:hypothetical protein
VVKGLVCADISKLKRWSWKHEQRPEYDTHRKKMCDDNIPKQPVPLLRKRAINNGRNLYFVSDQCLWQTQISGDKQRRNGTYLLSTGQIPVKQARF